MGNRELLIIDLLPRIAYEIKALVCSGVGKGSIITIRSLNISPMCYVSNTEEGVELLENIKPYLFPMNSLTEGQRISLDGSMFYNQKEGVIENVNNYGNLVYTELEDCLRCIDWLNSHHIDYRGLIEKDLAIDATGLGIYSYGI